MSAGRPDDPDPGPEPAESEPAEPGAKVEQPVLAVSAVVIDDGRLLMVRRGGGPAAGRWSVPGGRVEADESLSEALIREVGEETGAVVVPGGLLGVVEVIADDGHWVILGYEADIVSAAGGLRAGDDADAVEWVRLAEVLDRELAGNLADFLVEHRVVPARP